MNSKEQKGFLKMLSTVIIGYILPIILANLGGILIPENILLGISIVVLAFLIFYLTSHISQIKTNQDSIAKIEEEIVDMKKEVEIDRKLLNTIDRIIIQKRLQR